MNSVLDKKYHYHKEKKRLKSMKISIQFDDEVKTIQYKKTDGPKTLWFSFKPYYINSLDDIVGISATKDMLIISTAHPKFRNGTPDDVTQPIDRITAYDWDGNLIWGIRDIIPDISDDWLGGYIVDRKSFLKSNKVTFDYPEGRVIYACFSGDVRYLIDPYTKEILAKDWTK